MSSAPVIDFTEAKEFARRIRFKGEDFNTLSAGRVMWRVKGLWPRVGVCFAGGPSMCGKTFWVLDAMVRLCRGEPILGRKAVKAGVIYVGAEDPGGIRLRIEGLRDERGFVPEGSFQFIGQAPDLTNPEDVEALRVALVDMAADMNAKGFALGVVAIDTMSATIPGADENTAKDMSPVLAALHSLALELEAMVLMVAHTGKDAERGLRGWSGLLANADGLIMLEAPEEDATRTGRVIKVKNGPAGDQFAFTLRALILGQDDDGDDITTCVVDHTDVPQDRTKARPVKLNASATLVLTTFNRMGDDGQLFALPFCPGMPSGTVGTSYEQLREAAFRMGLNMASKPPEGADKKAFATWADTRRRSFERAVDKLLEAEKLRQEGGYLWAL